VTVLISVFSSDKNNKYAKHNGKNKISHPPKIKIKIKIPSPLKSPSSSQALISPQFLSISITFSGESNRILR
jgi:hypothetical protein